VYKTILAALAALLTFTFAGCTTEVTTPTPESSPAQAGDSQGPSPDAADTDADQAEDDSNDADAASDDSDADDSAGGDSRADFTPTRSTTCEDGYLIITDMSGVVEVKGACETLTIIGAGITVLADEVTTLKVESIGATVIVKSAVTIDIAGQGCTVIWETGDPSVESSGIGNTARQAD
jgi:hypothetical protein